MLTAKIIWASKDIAERVRIRNTDGGVHFLDPEDDGVLPVTLPDGLVAENAECVARLDGFRHTNVGNDCVDGAGP